MFTVDITKVGEDDVTFSHDKSISSDQISTVVYSLVSFTTLYFQCSQNMLQRFFESSNWTAVSKSLQYGGVQTIAYKGVSETTMVMMIVVYVFYLINNFPIGVSV